MIFEDWGLIPYQEALNKQLVYVDLLTRNPEHPGFLVFCTHPPVVTVGRQTEASDVFSWTGELVEISRGGRATYHGPSQLVIYPILNLKNPRAGRGPQEIRGYLRALEQAIVLSLKEFGIEAIGRTPQKKSTEKAETDETGVWVGSQKVASLGIAVKNWISFHGAAINLSYDPKAFQGLNPCGFKSETMVSVETLFGQQIDRNQFSKILKKFCFELL